MNKIGPLVAEIWRGEKKKRKKKKKKKKKTTDRWTDRWITGSKSRLLHTSPKHSGFLNVIGMLGKYGHVQCLNRRVKKMTTEMF